MESILDDSLQNSSSLTVEFCENHGLKLFEEFNFMPLETLGKGAFGEVIKAMAIKNREMMAVKKIQIEGINKKKIIENIASYLIEIEALKHIERIGNQNLASFKGSFYTLLKEDSSKIQNVVLVTEAGDFTLEKLIKCRKNQNKNPPYTPQEALSILIPLSRAYKSLQENRIYHSDTKLENIVYSASRKSYIIIDFGVSNLLRDSESDEIEMCYFVRGGTDGYNSPEKSRYLKNGNSEEFFNPFKCDMWSLGVCLEKMCCKDISMPFIDHPLLERIRKGLKENKWENRWDSKKLCQELSEYESSVALENLSLDVLEADYLDLLQKEMWAAHPDLINLYSSAYLPQEVLKMALQEQKNFKEKYGNEIDSRNWSDYDMMLTNLGISSRLVNKR